MLLRNSEELPNSWGETPTQHKVFTAKKVLPNEESKNIDEVGV